MDCPRVQNIEEEEKNLLCILEFLLQSFDAILDLMHLIDESILSVVPAQLNVGSVGAVLKSSHG